MFHQNSMIKFSNIETNYELSHSTTNILNNLDWRFFIKLLLKFLKIKIHGVSSDLAVSLYIVNSQNHEFFYLSDTNNRVLICFIKYFHKHYMKNSWWFHLAFMTISIISRKTMYLYLLYKIYMFYYTRLSNSSKILLTKFFRLSWWNS